MSYNTILLFGSNGQIGHELIKTLDKLGEVIQLSRKDVDFEDTDKLRYVINNIQPTIIVNAAAYTAVEQAEFDLRTAHTVNATAPKILAEEAQKIGSILVQYSTDYVFDGKKQSSYHENDSPNPQSVYGATKLAGENNVMQSCKKHLIFRTSWVFGMHGNNFLKTILRLAAQQKNLRIVSDQTGVPTSAALVETMTARILNKISDANSDEDCWGLYHLTSKGKTSWYGYASYVISQALSLGFTLTASPETLIPITTADYPLSVNRPANSCLDTEKICLYFNFDLPDWKIEVNKMLNSLMLQQKCD